MIIESVQEPSGKWRIRALLSNGNTEFLWFDHEATEDEVKTLIEDRERRTELIVASSGQLINLQYHTPLEILAGIRAQLTTSLGAVCCQRAAKMLEWVSATGISDDELLAVMGSLEAVQQLRELALLWNQVSSVRGF